jgi:DNA-binding transcriptional MocR family regulator
MLAALERSMPHGVEWTQPRGGFFTWLTLAQGLNASQLAVAAAERGVAVVPGALFFPDGRGAENLRLSFSWVEDERIDEGVERLASLLAAQLKRLRRSR